MGCADGGMDDDVLELLAGVDFSIVEDLEMGTFFKVVILEGVGDKVPTIGAGVMR